MRDSTIIEAFENVSQRINQLESSFNSLNQVTGDIIGKNLMHQQAVNKILTDKGIIDDTLIKAALEFLVTAAKTEYDRRIKEAEEKREALKNPRVSPEEALKEAAKILIQHFMLFSDENLVLESQAKEETKEVDEEILPEYKEMLKDIEKDDTDKLSFDKQKDDKKLLSF